MGPRVRPSPGLPSHTTPHGTLFPQAHIEDSQQTHAKSSVLVVIGLRPPWRKSQWKAQPRGHREHPSSRGKGRCWLQWRLKVFLPPPGSSQGAISSTLATTLLKPAAARPWLPHQRLPSSSGNTAGTHPSSSSRYFLLLPRVVLTGSLPPVWLQTLPLQQQLHLDCGQPGQQLQHLSLCCSQGRFGSSRSQKQQWGAALGPQPLQLCWLAGSRW